MPRATSSSEGYSATWVGLGGASDSSSALEQVGTQVLPLANFGRIAFSSATATANGHTGTISDVNWSAERVNLVSSDAGYGGGPGPRFASFATGEATTSSLRQSGSAFSVAYSG